MRNTHNVLLTLHPEKGAEFHVAHDGAVSAVTEASGGALLATVAVNGRAPAESLRDAARAFFLTGGWRHPAAALAVRAVRGWLSAYNTVRGTEHVLSIRPGILD